MISDRDFIHLPYTTDLSLGGVTYACRSLNYTFDRMGGSPYERLRRIAAGVAVELALRRHLNEREIPYDVLGATPYTEPDRYDVAIGGRRCDVKSYFIYRREKIRALRRQPAHLLEAPALIPSDQLLGPYLRDTDLFVFAFLLGLLATGGSDLARAERAGQPHYLVHAMPTEWARPVLWSSLGGLVLKVDCPETQVVELGGQNSRREFISERLDLPPNERRHAVQDYYNLTYIHIQRLPGGRVGIHSPTLRQTHIVETRSWENIWIYGMEIALAGYETVAGFRRRARRLPPGSRVLQYPATRIDNMSLPLAELRPLEDLFARATRWNR